jgi:hypothetical protein
MFPVPLRARRPRLLETPVLRWARAFRPEHSTAAGQHATTEAGPAGCPGTEPALSDEARRAPEGRRVALSGRAVRRDPGHQPPADAPTLQPREALCTARSSAPSRSRHPGPSVSEFDLRVVAALAALRTGGAGPDVPVLAATRFERALLGELLLRVLAALREVGKPEARWRPRLVEVGTARVEAERRLGARTVGPHRACDRRPGRPRGARCTTSPSWRSGPSRWTWPSIAVSPGRSRQDPHRLLAPRPCGAVWGHALAGLAAAAVVLPGARLVDGLLHGPVALVPARHRPSRDAGARGPPARHRRAAQVFPGGHPRGSRAVRAARRARGRACPSPAVPGRARSAPARHGRSRSG